jgi:hypothetical protein
MRECTINEGRANRTRATSCVLAIAVLVALGTAGTGPAAAADFEVGELRAHVDTTVSVGASMRASGRDCKLIHVTNGGCAESGEYLNSDDGNLNYEKWDVFANTYKATVDVDLAWKNFGGFFRGSLFYDLITMNTNTDRTRLERDALYRSSPINSGVVGMGYQLLDAYVYGNFDVAGRPLDIRIGNQVLNWGESLFYGTSINAINTIDLARFRAPGSELKEALLPAPMVRVSAELFRNFSIEGFYQLYWNRTQLDPAGSYFADATFSQDVVGRGAEATFVVYDPGIEDKYFQQVARQLATEPDLQLLDIPLAELAALDPAEIDVPQVRAPHLLGARPGDLPRTVEEMIEAVHTPVAPYFVPLRPPLINPFADAIIQGYVDAGFNPRVQTRIPPFFPFAIPRLKDEKPSSQGQWGVALRYFWEAIRTELGLYYIRMHDKSPSVGFVAEPVDIVVLPTYEDTFVFTPVFELFNPLVPIVQRAAIPAGYFREYPEDINIFGVSAATELFGIAWGAEISYRNRLPVPIDGALLLENLLLEVIETGQQMRVSGFAREKRLQAQLNAIATLGPGDPYVGAIVRLLRCSSIAATLEVAAVEFPSLDDDIVYQGPPGGGEVDELSWGYTTRIQGFYDNPLGIPITVVPRIQFFHDVDGNTPGRYPFIEHRKGLQVGVNVDYLGVWQFDLSYNNSWGASAANGINDRDWVSASVTYSF